MKKSKKSTKKSKTTKKQTQPVIVKRMCVYTVQKKSKNNNSY